MEQGLQPVEDMGTVKNPDTISWTASEFVAHEKNAGWYGLLAGAAALLAVLVYFVTKDFVSVGVVVAAALVLGAYATTKPRELLYNLDSRGVSIGNKHFPYSDFRSFSVVPERAFSSIVLMPLRRFAVPVTIYYAPDDEDKILDLLASQLPFDQPPRDAVGNLMRRIRF